MKFRTSRKLKNMILSINVAILTFFFFFFFFLSNFLKHFRFGRYENLFIFFFGKAIKIAGSAQNKNRVGRVSGNRYFFRPNQYVAEGYSFDCREIVYLHLLYVLIICFVLCFCFVSEVCGHLYPIYL